jgi:hypothetical protein
MRKIIHSLRHSRLTGGFAAIVAGAVLLAFSVSAVAQYEDYDGAESCGECHETQYNEWRVSGHPYKLMKGEDAINRPIPLPEGISWDDVSYVIGGYKWKSRYIDNEGYIITSVGEDGDIPGQNQYNYLTDHWVDYNAGEENKPYNCGRCHTTGWIADEDADTDNDLTDNQDGLPGMHGTFFAGGIQCEQCHGPGFASMEIDSSAEACGQCHYRGALPGEENYIPASGGFIRHHEQYNEHVAGPHGSFDCVDCHNPHKRGEFSITRTCDACHSGLAEGYAQTTMADYGVTCEDCHMGFASKSAEALGPHQGDVMTHLFYINTDPAASMFTEDGSEVALDDEGKGAVTMDFACQRCHETATLEELAKFAVDFHSATDSLENFGLDPGLTGTWWNSDRAGEGILLEVGYINGDLFFFASFYTYDATGNQVWLTAQLSSQDGTTANVNVFMPDSGQWGDDFDPGTVNFTEWGAGSFSFPACGSGSFTITPNQAMMDLGFTELSYGIERTLDSGIACPTFVNNASAP